MPRITCIAMIFLQLSYPSNVSNAGHDVIWQGTVLDSKHSNICAMVAAAMLQQRHSTHRSGDVSAETATKLLP